MGGSNSISRPPFRSVFNGDGLFCPFLFLLPLANMQKYGAALGRKTFPAENMLKQRRQTRDEIGLVYFTTPSTLDFERKKIPIQVKQG